MWNLQPFFCSNLIRVMFSTIFGCCLSFTADIDARPWDFQAEECTLRANIEAFNSRRYDKPQDSEFAPVDNCLQSVLGQRLELPEDFHYSYELWLEREVFSQPIRWEELLHCQWQPHLHLPRLREGWRCRRLRRGRLVWIWGVLSTAGKKNWVFPKRPSLSVPTRHLVLEVIPFLWLLGDHKVSAEATEQVPEWAQR